MENNSSKKPTLGICIPVWNRGEIFSIAIQSLLRQLEGIDATIWLFDNGSDPATQKTVFNVQSDNYRIVKTFFPKNMGIPYATNVFLKAIQENGDFGGYSTPDYLMVMDADAYFQKPIIDLIYILENDYSVGLVSGHDSIEHPAINEFEEQVFGRNLHIKEKMNERMITMLMRKEEMLYNYPFAHYRNRDVDWEITTWSPYSLLSRKRRLLVVCDYVLHLGANKSTWNPNESQSETQEELEAVRKILAKHP